MLSNQHFYHRSIRKLVVSFGTLFNDIEIVRFDNSNNPKERFKVPISYGPKEKYISRLYSDPTLTKSINTLVPRMSFNLDSLSFDPTRKQITTIRNFSANTNTSFNSQFVPVPYSFDFSLSIYVRNVEDGTQIIEQILPFFAPDFTVTIDFIPSMNQKYDVPFILNSVETSTEYEGALEETRLVTWDLSFTAKSYLWPPVKSSGVIRQANTNITSDVTMNNTVVRIVTVPDPLNANVDSDFGFSETIIES